MSANDKQIGGDHYKTGGLNHWDIVEMFGLGYFEGQITKYLFRWEKKGGIKDLEKAAHFLEKYIEIQKAKLPKEEDEPLPARSIPPAAPTPENLKTYIWPDISIPPENSKTAKAPHPVSTPDFTYEGGKADVDMYRCRKCRKHFSIPIGCDPKLHHTHPEGEPAKDYAP